MGDPVDPTGGCAARRSSTTHDLGDQVMPSLLPERPSALGMRRGSVQTPQINIRKTIVQGHRRNTIIMPLLEFFSNQGRHHQDSSLSFRSGSILSPPKQEEVVTENTYRLEPSQKFPMAAARAIMAAALEARLTGKEYDPQRMAHESKVLSDMIQERMKVVTPPRYKTVCWVMIGQKEQADVQMASRGLWNDACDTYTQEVFENLSLYAVAVLYAVYNE